MGALYISVSHDVALNRGSYMSARVLLHLLNELEKRDKMVERLFIAVPRGCLLFVIVVFPDHTHLLFLCLAFYLSISTCLVHSVAISK